MSSAKSVKKADLPNPNFATHQIASDAAGATEASGQGRALRLEHVPAYFLIAVLLIALYFLYASLAPFVTVIIFSAVIVTAFYPLHVRMLRRFKNPGLTAFLSCVVVMLCIVIPLIVLFFLLASEAVSAYALIQAKLNAGFLDTFIQWKSGGFLYDLYVKYLPDLQINSLDLSGQVSSIAQQGSAFFVDNVRLFVSSLMSLSLAFLIMSVTLFYFFKDGKTITHRLMELSPLPSVYEDRLLNRLRLMTKATLYGTFLTAAIQGLIGGIGFAIAGIDNPVLWGTVMAFFALLPYIGTGLVWMPAVIILLVTGATGPAIFLFLWGMLIVGTVDNFIRPYLIGSSSDSSSLLTFLVILGGIIVWGFPGVIFGPLILTVSAALIEIYEKEYRPVMKQLQHHIEQ